MSRAVETDWETATWEGSRRAQLRAALELTVRERLQALDDLAAMSQRLKTMPRERGQSDNENRPHLQIAVKRNSK